MIQLPVRRLLFLLLLLFSASFGWAQKRSAGVSGRIMDEEERPLPGVSVTILGQQKGLTADDSGRFTLKVPVDKAFALLFTHTGYRTVQQNFLLNEGESETV